ncbi:LysR family transcriptional regulator [Rhizomonospora bruguierae]|uniref:LysR family transcriptional regulator n=1 Tax=Rhizomonospora bruguierae TaxID=1581705 RepID=UPI001BCF8005|nr:LysR family transcriptional regulator [Micromonospora sp. NBRC 107566]
MDLELRHLRVVCAIAETGSVTKAAAALGLAQPALTAQLQRIERTLGGALFDRDRRGARPTALGELVLARARVLLPAVKGLQDDAARLAGSGDPGGPPGPGRFRLGVTSGPILGGLVHRLAAAHPQAHITTQASFSVSRLAEMLLAGRLDFALAGACGDSLPAPDPGLTWHVIGVDAVFLLMSRRHPMAGRREVNLAELADARWMAAPGDGCFADCFADACARAGFTPRHVLEIDIRGAQDLLDSGDAVALCQSTFRPLDGLVTVPITGTPLRWRQLLGWQPGGPAAGVAPRVVAYASESYAEAIARNARYTEWLAGNEGFGIQQFVPV